MFYYYYTLIPSDRFLRYCYFGFHFSRCTLRSSFKLISEPTFCHNYTLFHSDHWFVFIIFTLFQPLYTSAFFQVNFWNKVILLLYINSFRPVPLSLLFWSHSSRCILRPYFNLIFEPMFSYFYTVIHPDQHACIFVFITA